MTSSDLYPLKTTTNADGVVQACLALASGTSSCICPTISVPKATGVCNTHINERISVEDIGANNILNWQPVWKATIDAYDGNNNLFQSKSSPISSDSSVDTPGPYWNYTLYDTGIVIPKGTLPYSVMFFFTGITNGTWPEYWHQADLPPGVDWDIEITSPPFNWTTKDTDQSKLPHCEVGGWDPSDYDPFRERPREEWHSTNRQIDCH